MATSSFGILSRPFSSLSKGIGPAVPTIGAPMSGSSSPVLKPTAPAFNFVTTPGVQPSFNVATQSRPSPLSMGTLSIPSSIPTPSMVAAPMTPATPFISKVGQNPSVGPGAIVTTPSGASVNQYTGALIKPAVPGGTTPTVPNSIFGTSTGALANAGTSTSPVTPAVQGLTSLAASNPATGTQAYDDYQKSVGDLQAFEIAMQKGFGNIGSQPIPMPFIQGQQQVMNTENAGILDALQQAVLEKQQAIGLGIQGAGAQGTFLSSAGNLANSGQATKQSALATAAGATAPVAGASFFGTPETGGMVGEGSQAMHDAVALQVQKLQNGTTDPRSALAALSAYGQVGVNALQAALGPDFNLNTASGTAAAQTSNAGLAGTATPEAANAVYQKAYGDYQNLQQATSNVDQFGTLLTEGMTDSTGNAINPTASKYANMTIAQFRSQLSSPQQAQFDSTLAALRAKVSGMLSIGGSETPTQLTSDANGIIDGSAPIGTLKATLSRIQNEGNIMMQNQATKVNQAKQNITPPSQSNFGTKGSASGADPLGIL